MGTFERRVLNIVRKLQALAFKGSPTQYARLNDAANRLATAVGARNAPNRKRKPRKKRAKRKKPATE
jgi:hypothetical protein